MVALTLSSICSHLITSYWFLRFIVYFAIVYVFLTNFLPLSVFMPSCIPCLSGFVVHPSIHPSTTHQSFIHSIYLSIYLSIYPSVHELILSMCLYMQFLVTPCCTLMISLPSSMCSVSSSIYVATCTYYPFRSLAPGFSTCIKVSICLKYLKFQVLRASLIINLISNISTVAYKTRHSLPHG